MKRVLFLDRDGTIIVEPPEDFQVDSLEKLSFLPSAISSLKKIGELSNFEFVMVTNQDGLGTDSFPEKNFWPAHNKMLEILEAEGIVFSDILIDRTRPEDQADTRKPGTGLLKSYIDGDYDLANSFVIGDRKTDVELAENLGAKGILLDSETAWPEITDLILAGARNSKVVRVTSETNIVVELAIDGSGKGEISTGLSFFDHMLEQVAKHSGTDISIKVKGDLHIDEHHTIEDTALALGEAYARALGDKRGIARYGFLLPMDEALAQVALDFSGRPWLVWEGEFSREMIGDMPTEMFMHFFKSFSDASKSNLNIKVEGENEHHKIESVFKAFGKCIKQAVALDGENMKIPSTKGVL